MPKPPSTTPTLKRALLRSKLTAVRRATSLGTHDEPQFANGKYVGEGAVSNRWAVVYGRVEVVPDIDEDCGSEGCGGMDVAIVVIATPENVFGLLQDGTTLRDE